MKSKPPLIVATIFGLLASGQIALAQEPTPLAAPSGAPPVDAVPPPVAVPVPVPVIVPVPVTQTAVVPEEPLAGVSNQTMFLRSPDNQFVFFPGGRLQTDGYFYKSSNSGLPKDTFLLKRARLELAGWISPMVFFNIAADFAVGTPSTSTIPVSQTNLNTTDDYVAIAPWGDLAILQFGQYDAPFTLENRTSDKYFDFLERSLTVRAFGIPSNKEQGFMLHGTNPNRNYYYSLGVFNGDGQNFRNVDNNFDFMMRAWIAPLSFLGDGPFHDVTAGGSYWTGNRTFGEPLLNQTTAGNYTFLNTSLPKLGADSQQINQQGRLQAWALELNVPFAHKYGVRWEYVNKDQPLSAYDTSVTPPVITAGMHLKGWSTYIEAWAWIMGDDRIIGEPGMQLPTRVKKFGVKAPQHGLMLVGRLELLDETLSADDPAGALAGVKGGLAGIGGLGKTKLQSYTLGFNYWISKRFRTSFNWVLNHFDQNTADATSNIRAFKSANEQEFSFRFAVAL